MSDRTELVVVNDDPTQLRLACALLERQGFTVHAASSAAEALRLLTEHADVAGLVTDLHMPEIDGWRLCRLLRSPVYERFNDLPILVISATFSGADAERLTVELGANAFLPAPYRPASLIRAVREMLAGRTPVNAVGVLIVEPEAGAYSGLARAFEAHGYAVCHADSCKQARHLFRRGAPDAVVVANVLPDGSALDLLPEFKRPGSWSVTIVTTHDHRPDLALDLVRCGADAYVPTPYEPGYVVELCERARRQRALLRVEELLEKRTVRLRESEQRLRAIFHALPEVVLVYEPNGRILQANPAALDALGYESLVGRNLNELLQPGDRSPSGWNGGIRRYETVFRTRHGRQLEVDVTETPFSLKGRDSVLAVWRDVAEKRRNEEERTLLATALEQAAEMVVVVGTDGLIRYVNPAFERITGYRRDAAVGAEIDMLRGGCEDPAWDEMRDALARGEAWSGRLEKCSSDGHSYISEGTYSPVRDESGRIAHYVAVGRDATQEVELEYALHQSQKMEAVGTLAGGIAHDFNNLLTGILGYANLVRRLAPAETEIAEMAEIIESSADRAAQLTKQLLGFARRGKYRNAPFDLNEVVEQAVLLLERAIDKSIRIDTDLRERPTTVLGDSTQIEQALVNLALNSRDAMAGRDHGTLRLETGVLDLDEAYCAHHPGARPGHYVVVAVTDDGCGIAPEDIDRIFEPFFTTKPRGQGTGMGLSMVYGIVKSHGGTIRVYSELGVGTTFRVYLPFHLTDAAAIEEPPAAEPVYGSGRILVIDDEQVVRQTASAVLKELGYDVMALSEGEEAVLYYRHFGESIACVLLDMVMPGMSGHETFLALKELDPDVKAVLTTGFGLNDAAQAILDDGALGFVPKPYRAAELSEVIARAIRGEAVPSS